MKNNNTIMFLTGLIIGLSFSYIYMKVENKKIDDDIFTEEDLNIEEKEELNNMINDFIYSKNVISNTEEVKKKYDTSINNNKNTEITKNIVEMEPYILTEAEFEQAYKNHDKITLLYYTKTNKLIDDDSGEIIDNIYTVCGKPNIDLIDSGEIKEICYIRNDILKQDYIILVEEDE